jgi:hypothetical protein
MERGLDGSERIETDLFLICSDQLNLRSIEALTNGTRMKLMRQIKTDLICADPSHQFNPRSIPA